MPSPNDVVHNMFGEWSFLAQEQSPAINSEALPTASSIPPEITITETTSNDSNVGGSGSYCFTEWYMTPNPTVGVNLIPKQRDLSSDGFQFNVPNAIDPGIFQPPWLSFQQNNGSFQPTQKFIETANEIEAPSPPSVRAKQSLTSPFTTQSISPSSMSFESQPSFLTASNDFARSGPTLMTPRRNSSPPILTTPQFVMSPSPLGGDEGNNGDWAGHVKHFTSDGERKNPRYGFRSQLN